MCNSPSTQVQEAEKQEKAAEEEREKAKKKVFGMVKPVSTLDKLRSTLVNMKKVGLCVCVCVCVRVCVCVCVRVRTHG